MKDSLLIFTVASMCQTIVHAEGEAVMYEGSRLYHGRPDRLQGGTYAGVFVGFVPVGYPSGSSFATRTIVASSAYVSELAKSGYARRSMGL